MKPGNMPQGLYQRWQFAIEINGFDLALFSKSSLPKTDFEVTSFNPAGSMFPQKLAGRVSFDDITLEKGVLQDGSERAALDWLQAQIDVNSQTGKLPEEYMRDVDLVQYDRQGNETRRWTLHQAWIKTLEYDDLEGGSSENLIEKITLCYQFHTIG